MRDFFRWLKSYKPSRRSQGGWAVAVPAAVSLATSIFGKNAAKKSASDAATQQTNLANQAQQQYAGQQGALRNAVTSMASGPNPYQQAAQSMHPYFSTPGADVAQFGPSSPFGSQYSPVQGNPSFTIPPPQQVAQGGPGMMQPLGAPAHGNGWTNYGLMPSVGGGGGGLGPKPA